MADGATRLQLHSAGIFSEEILGAAVGGHRNVHDCTLSVALLIPELKQII